MIKPLRSRSRFWQCLLAGLAVGGLFAAPAGAHPHAWIDVRIQVELNDDGDAVALRETWLFDEYYTAFATEGMDGNGDGLPDAEPLAELLALNMENLEEYDYFTRAEGKDGRIGIGTATEMSSQMDGNRLRMDFVVPLETPVPLGEQVLRYTVYDPTYYIEILHLDAPDAVTFSGGPDNCRYALNPPAPDPETVSLAFALDQMETAPEGLGIHFAEWAAVRCD